MGLSIVTIVIIVANILITQKGHSDYAFYQRYLFNVGAVRRGEHIRMFTSGFLHVDTKHLAFNMITLFFFAGIVINRLGELKFIIVYLSSLILGNLFSLYFNKDNYYYSAVGASGAVTGIIYSAILFDPWMKINFIIPGFVFALAYLLYSIYGMKTRVGNIDHNAHFGGAVGGYVVTLMFAPFLLKTQLLMVGLLAVPILILFVMHKTGKL